jgi:molecular chaperone GrpE
LAEEEKLVSGNEIPEQADGEEILELTEGLEKEFAEEKEKSAKYLENWQKAEADFSNYRKRIEQEKEDLARGAVSSVLLRILPVIDDLERAFDSLPAKPKDASWVDGIKLIHRKVQAALEAQGLSEINAFGETFDPNLHEAVAYQDGKEGKVIAIARKGYKLNDRVLRATQVVVGKGGDGSNMSKPDSDMQGNSERQG